MSFEAKVSPYALKIIYDHGLEEKGVSDNDFMLGRDLKTKLNAKFHDIKYLLTGENVTISFTNRRQMEILHERSVELQHCVRSRKFDDWLRRFKLDMHRVSDSKEIKRLKRMKELKIKTNVIVKSLNGSLNKEAKALFNQLPEDFAIKPIIIWNKNRIHSIGSYDANELDSKFGDFGAVEIAMMSFFDDNGELKRKRYNEVDELRRDPVMGCFTSNQWQYHLMANYTLHYAHALVKYCYDELDMGAEYKRKYGSGFKLIFSHLRKTVINPILESKNIKIGKY